MKQKTAKIVNAILDVINCLLTWLLIENFLKKLTKKK